MDLEGIVSAINKLEIELSDTRKLISSIKSNAINSRENIVEKKAVTVTTMEEKKEEDIVIYGSEVKVDSGIADIIRALNYRGMVTMFSCSGHLKYDANNNPLLPTPYILMFGKKNDLLTLISAIGDVKKIDGSNDMGSDFMSFEFYSFKAYVDYINSFGKDTEIKLKPKDFLEKSRPLVLNWANSLGLVLDDDCSMIYCLHIFPSIPRINTFYRGKEEKYEKVISNFASILREALEIS